MKPSLFLRTCGAAFVLIFTGLRAHAAEVEVLHWWTSGGEAKSLLELRKMLDAKGDQWKDFAIAGGGGENAMTILKSRVVSGYAPTAAQIKGPSIQEWAEGGATANLDDVAKVGKWDSVLPQVVSNVMKYKGHYVAVPVNVHRVNWLWINPEVFKTAGATVPKTWEEFFVAAEKLQKAGFIPLAHGGQPWQDFTLFESIVLGVGGAEFYKKAFIKLDEIALTSPTMEKAFSVMRTMRKYIDKDFAGRDWNVATALVINGKAGMQFMGDWAKGEFTAAGKSAGKDYFCVAAPGTSDAYTFNIDSFVMFSQKSADAKKGQIDLAEAMMSPAFQEVFNLNKGSIPARIDMKMDKFDACSKKSNIDFVAASKKNTLLPSIAHVMAVPEGPKSAMQEVVSKFLNSDMPTKDALAKLAAASKVK